MSEKFRVLASSCGSCGCGCPTVIEAGDDAIVVVGSATSALVDAATVRRMTGAGEAAVVIPKSLLIEAIHALRL